MFAFCLRQALSSARRVLDPKVGCRVVCNMSDSPGCNRSCPLIHDADIKLCVELYRFPRFDPDDWADERLTNTANAFRSAVNLVVVHIFLLPIDFAQRVETLGLSHRKPIFN